METSVPPPFMTRGVNLPVEIIIEILSRLPVKSLIRFRCVSTSWCSLIIDQSFIKKHLSQATNLNSKRVMACGPSGIHQVFSFPLDPSLPSNNNPIKDLVKDCPLQSRKGRIITFLDAFNGLFCIFIDAELLLWNPSIRQSRRVLSPPNDTSPDIGASFFSVAAFAFGYDSFSDDYRVVRIVMFPGRGSRTETKVYSLKTDSWRKLQGCPYPFHTKCNGKFANGLFYWLLENYGHDQGSNPSHEIISLQLSTEEYEKIPFPDDYHMPTNHEIGLTVLKGMLCLYINYIGSHFVLWTMKDDSVSKSWIKMIELQYQNVPKPSPKSRLSGHYIVPKYLFENGEFLLEAEENHLGAALILYRENGLGVRIKIGEYVRQSYVYEETLVSPYLNNGV